MKLEAYLKEKENLVRAKLDEILPQEKAYPSLIHQAMRYSVFNGGKRIRPILLLACAEACSGSVKKALIPACAVELFHAYSLIHDDLPCLDNDEFRRGSLTCHRKFGEPYALLAGDALLTLGFHLLGKVDNPKLALKLIQEISQAIGTFGMIGGQVVDKISETESVDLPTLDYINANKTGKLIRVSCLAGGVISEASPQKLKALGRFGEYLGLVFQVVDDIMDGNGYLKLMSESEARRKAQVLTDRAKKSLRSFGSRGEKLKELADFILTRKK